jgi:hypothetical protein
MLTSLSQGIRIHTPNLIERLKCKEACVWWKVVANRIRLVDGVTAITVGSSEALKSMLSLSGGIEASQSVA